ncbi:MAG TPA: maleylacetate reductase [Arsenicitalea sp.]|jgi:alcohol dehydrogenase class IV|nr:maleylacetate reductase [Arsenicitalea sp.]
MEPFVYQALSQRVVFGSGTLARVGEEIERLGCKRAIVLSTASQERKALALAHDLAPLSAGIFAGAAMHAPVEVTDDALRAVAAANADCLVSLGGGSTIGLGKALALRTDLPQIAIPTSYAGSEATPILGETAAGRKTTQRSPKILPEVIVYDVDLTLSLPPALTVTSGINAMAHAIEALYAKERNPLISILALEGIRALVKALPVLTRNPADKTARSDALYAAWACGTCLGAVGMALHHKICHVLGGSFDLPHAETHTVILPHAVGYNEGATRGLLRPVAEIFGAETAAEGLFKFERTLGAPMTLAGIGMPEAGLDRAADEIVANPYWNPAPVERDRIRALLQDAFEGHQP